MRTDYARTVIRKTESWSGNCSLFVSINAPVTALTKGFVFIPETSNTTRTPRHSCVYLVRAALYEKTKHCPRKHRISKIKGTATHLLKQLPGITYRAGQGIVVFSQASTRLKRHSRKVSSSSQKRQKPPLIEFPGTRAFTWSGLPCTRRQNIALAKTAFQK